MSTWELAAAEHEMIAREIEPCLPERVFYAHLYCEEQIAAIIHRDVLSLLGLSEKAAPCISIS